VLTNWAVILSGSYTDAKLTSNLPGSNLPGGVGQTGDRLPFVPDYSLALTSQYTVSLTSNWEGLFDVSFQRQGSSQSFFNRNTSGGAVDPQGNTVPAYDITNIRLGVVHGDLNVTLYASNLFNSHAATSIDRLRPGFLPDGSPLVRSIYVVEPLTVGVNVKKDF
jgi:hypothetical protein